MVFNIDAKSGDRRVTFPDGRVATIQDTGE
jgi:hypothetical protein